MRRTLPHIAATPGRFASAAALSALAALPWLGSFEHGPVALRRAQAEMHTRLQRAEAQIRSHVPVGAEEQALWRARLDTLELWIPEASDEPRMLAELARHLEGASVRDLELLPLPDAPGEKLLDWETLELTDPLRSRVIPLRAVPVRIRLRADYADMASILETLESRSAPLLPSRLQIERERDGLRLESELLFVVRGSARDEG